MPFTITLICRHYKGTIRFYINDAIALVIKMDYFFRVKLHKKLFKVN